MAGAGEWKRGAEWPVMRRVEEKGREGNRVEGVKKKGE